MSTAYTINGKRRSSMTHARRTYTCVCGKECSGNGGWSSHKRACVTLAEKHKEQRDWCTDPDNCRRCKAPAWQQTKLNHAGIPLGEQRSPNAADQRTP